jgi:hypothetical protein
LGSIVARGQWRSKYGGMDASLISEMKQLQAENARLKRMYADMAMQNELVNKRWQKSNEAIFPMRDGPTSSRGAWCQRCAGMPRAQKFPNPYKCLPCLLRKLWLCFTVILLAVLNDHELRPLRGSTLTD